MNLTTNLSEFNRRFTDEWRHIFPAGVEAFQDVDGTLFFRGPVPILDDPAHVGCHFSVRLDDAVKAALRGASQPEREKMMENLSCSLGNQMQTIYSPSKIGPIALDAVGRMDIIEGRD